MQEQKNQNIAFDVTDTSNEKKFSVLHHERSSTGTSIETMANDDKRSIVRAFVMRKKNFIKRGSRNDQPVKEGPPYHTMSIVSIAGLLKTDLESGLKENSIDEKQAQYGVNEMEGDGGVNPIKLLMKQFFNILVLILVIAMAVSFAFKDWVEGGVIAGIMLINAGIGFLQEYKAEKTMDSLRQMASPTAQVIRDGHEKTISTKDLVPGDLVILNNGDVVGADCRVIDSFNMEVDEALLTGESLPVSKV